MQRCKESVRERSTHHLHCRRTAGPTGAAGQRIQPGNHRSKHGTAASWPPANAGSGSAHWLQHAATSKEKGGDRAHLEVGCALDGHVRQDGLKQAQHRQLQHVGRGADGRSQWAVQAGCLRSGAAPTAAQWGAVDGQLERQTARRFSWHAGASSGCITRQPTPPGYSMGSRLSWRPQPMCRAQGMCWGQGALLKASEPYLVQHGLQVQLARLGDASEEADNGVVGEGDVGAVACTRGGLPTFSNGGRLQRVWVRRWCSMAPEERGLLYPNRLGRGRWPGKRKDAGRRKQARLQRQWLRQRGYLQFQMCATHPAAARRRSAGWRGARTPAARGVRPQRRPLASPASSCPPRPVQRQLAVAGE